MELLKTYKVKIEGYDVNGYGVTHIDNKVLFVEGALEGETVIAKITNIHKKYAFSVCERVLDKSPDRTIPNCHYYEYCGGCDLMHLNYECEAKIKENKVKQTLRSFNNVKFNPIIKANNIYGYRNKIMVPFQCDEDDDIIYGFYAKGSHEVISMDKCLISDDLSNEILHTINRFLNVFHISIYDENIHKGLFREVMIRRTKTNEYMIVLVTTQYYDFSKLVELLVENYQSIKSIYLNINKEKTNVVLSNEYKLIYGNETIIEDILGLKFNVSPASFLQVNHDQCELLYKEAIRMANINKNMNVIDAYCGMGSITLNIARNYKHVYGIEIVDAAIENAKINMQINNITNATFICGKCEEEIKKLTLKERIDVIIFDPPRKGCDEEFLKTVVEMNIPKIVYVSCNIATAARDFKYLLENDYEIKEVTPVDLFPRTQHVEVVTLLELKTDKNN